MRPPFSGRNEERAPSVCANDTKDQESCYHVVSVALRASLLVRLSPEDAARIRKEASSEHRSLSGYLLNILERSFFIEQKLAHGANVSMLSRQARAILGPQHKKLRTAVHLRCTVEQAARIREYAARRQLSISDFVRVFAPAFVEGYRAPARRLNECSVKTAHRADRQSKPGLSIVTNQEPNPE